MVASLDAYRFLRASMQRCSWQAGWRSVLVREYEDTPCVDMFTTAATPDYYLCLVTSGSCKLEKRTAGQWHASAHRTGSLAFLPPGAASTLRWHSHEPHQTLQLHLPAMFFEDAADSARGNNANPQSVPPMQSFDDPVIGSVMHALGDAMQLRAQDIYAETAAQFLAAHILQRHGGVSFGAPPGREDARLRRADDYLRNSLSEPVSLSGLARIAGVSRFHLLRLFKAAYGETPLKRLHRMRMDEARRLLTRSNLSVTEISLRCGYDNPANFAVAFRRHAGASPSGFRNYA